MRVFVKYLNNFRNFWKITSSLSVNKIPLDLSLRARTNFELYLDKPFTKFLSALSGLQTKTSALIRAVPHSRRDLEDCNSTEMAATSLRITSIRSCCLSSVCTGSVSASTQTESHIKRKTIVFWLFLFFFILLVSFAKSIVYSNL